MVRGGKKNERTQSIILACLLWPFSLTASVRSGHSILLSLARARARVSHVSIECMSEVFCSRSHITSHLIHPNPKASVSISLRHSFFFRFFRTIARHIQRVKWGRGLLFSLARSLNHQSHQTGGTRRPHPGARLHAPASADASASAKHTVVIRTHSPISLAFAAKNTEREIKSTHITYVKKRGRAYIKNKQRAWWRPAATPPP